MGSDHDGGVGSHLNGTNLSSSANYIVNFAVNYIDSVTSRVFVTVLGKVHDVV